MTRTLRPLVEGAGGVGQDTVPAPTPSRTTAVGRGGVTGETPRRLSERRLALMRGFRLLPTAVAGDTALVRAATTMSALKRRVLRASVAGTLPRSVAPTVSEPASTRGTTPPPLHRTRAAEGRLKEGDILPQTARRSTLLTVISPYLRNTNT